MKNIYCVISWISTEKKTRGTYGPRITIENSDRKQDHFTKLKSARAAYNFRVKEIDAELSCSYRGQVRNGRVRLFVPHVSDNGLLMDWPTVDYIAQHDKSDQG
jgi:hypothetical protein